MPLPVLHPQPTSTGRSTTRAVFWLLAIVILAGCRESEPLLDPETRPRNLIVVVIDTLRQDHLECYGYRRTTAPVVCGLAADGVLFDGIAPSSWTKPATASLLTGLHPLRHQAIERNDRLPQPAETVAELLASRGFATLGFSANAWISDRFGFDQGFASLVRVPGSDHSPATGEEVNALALPAIARLTEPFFLYLHYVDPHEPYDPPIGWDGEVLAGPLADRAPITNADLDMANFIKRDPDLVRQAIDLYDGEIRAVDRQIGAVLERLRSRGLLDRTLIVVASDHGEEFDEHGRVGHGMTLYREVIRVPLIFHAPSAIPGGRHLGPANLMDVVPTALEMLAVEPSEDLALDGRSHGRRLVDADGSQDAERSHLLHLDLDGAAVLAMTQRDAKIVLAADPYRKELFEISADPQERHNLWAHEMPPIDPSALSRALADAYNRLHRQALERDTIETAGEVADSLRALGYLSPSKATLKPRLLPHRVRPADATPEGLRGWEPLDGLSHCWTVDDPDRSHQLLAGWRFAELEGRWTLPTATFLIGRPPGRGEVQLHLTGANFRAEPFRLQVELGSELVVDRTLSPGPFSVEVGVGQPALSASPVLGRLISEPAFEPRPPELGKPHWRLGVFVRRICLQRPTATGDSPGP